MRTLVAFLALLLSICQLSATDIRSGQDLIISQPVEGDLYLGANTLRINAPVNGDLYAAARSCYILDTIREDAVIMAQEIFLEAPVLDDARLMGGQVHIRADVFGDLVIGGGTVDIDAGVTIHGNLYAAGGTINLHGRVAGAVELAGGEVLFDGIAGGRSNLRGGNLHLAGTFQGPVSLAAEKIELKEGATFGQDIRYWTRDGVLDFGPFKNDDTRAQFDESLRGNLDDHGWRKALGVGAVVFTVGRALAAVLIFGLLVWAFPNFFRRTAKHLEGQYANSLGYGMVYLLATPLLILISLVTIIGIPVGIFSLATYGFSLGFAHIFTAFLFTYWWQEYQQQTWPKGKVILVAGAAFILLKLISWIPFIGWLVSLTLVAMTFGAILRELLHAKSKAAILPDSMDASNLTV